MGGMNLGKAVFAQLMDLVPAHEFRRCVERYSGNYKTSSFSCWDQFLCMAFAQLTYRETLLDLHGNIPAFISVAPAKIHEIHMLDQLLVEPGSIYLVDRAYLDFQRLYALKQALAFFIIRARKDFCFQRVSSLAVDKSTGLRCDQIIRL